MLRILGADLMDGTPVYDIKPYVEPDLHPDARFGFSGGRWERRVEVDFPPIYWRCFLIIGGRRQSGYSSRTRARPISTTPSGSTG